MKNTVAFGCLATGLFLSSSLAGCSSYYNGAIGLRSSDSQTAVAYKQRRAKQAQMWKPSRPHPELPLAPGDPRDRPAPLVQTGDQGVYPVMQGDDQPSLHGYQPSVTPLNWPESSPARASAQTPSRFPNRSAGVVQFDGGTTGDALPGGPISVFGSLPGLPDNDSNTMTGDDNARRVSFTQVGHDFDVAADPTSRRLIFASTRHRQTSDLYLQTIGGTAVTQLTSSPANDVQPAWHPTGRKLAFASDRSGNWDLYLLDLAGGQPVQLTNDPAHDLHPSFSPDGKQMVYCSYSSTERRWQLVLIDVDKPAVKRYLGPGLFPQWSPVGNKIIFQRARERGTRWFSAWTIDLVDGEPTRPTEVVASANAAIITPRWSPDGKQIVFCTVLDKAADNHARPLAADLWTMSADGRSRTRLTQGRHANLQPTWAGDGTIYFVSNRTRGGVENVWAVNPTANELVDSVEDVAEPSPSVPTP